MDDFEFLKKLADCNDKEQMARCIENHKPMTNADLIRAMSDEELADMRIHYNPVKDMYQSDCGEHTDFVSAMEAELAWLQQPAEEVHHE